MQFVWIGMAALSIWLVSLTFFFWKLSSHYNSLAKGVNKNNLQAILDSLLKDITVAKKDVAFLKDTCDRINQEGKFHIQKIGLHRFNPFKDTGGDQSFILTIVDGNDTGVIISGLYSRSGTRWYAKRIEYGKAVDHQLSDEELLTLREAKVIKK